jgi:DNA (cytosine-5)-methyltransferase 1
VRDPHRLGSPAAHSTSNRHRDGGTPSREGVPATTVAAGASVGGLRGPVTTSVTDSAADTASDRRDEGLSGAAWLQERPDAALGSRPTADLADRPGHQSGHRRRHLVAVPEPASGAVRGEVDWGVYTPAVRRWERVLGRPAPFPTQPGRHGRPVLAPAFVEWIQGLPSGWVTDLPLPRTPSCGRWATAWCPSKPHTRCPCCWTTSPRFSTPTTSRGGRWLRHDREKTGGT